NALAIGDLLVMHLADIGPAQEADALASQVDDDDILIGVRFLLATVVEGLFLRAFRPLSTPFGTIDDQPRLGPWSGSAPGKVIGGPLREDIQTIESLPQDGQQPLDPRVHARLTQAEELAHDDLERISLEIDQEEEQLLLRTVQDALSASAGASL